jgi:hypothetical protein
VLDEDSVARERTQDAIQALGVDAGFCRDVIDTAGASAERGRNPQFRDDRQGARHHRPAQEVPKNRFGRALTVQR